MEPGDPGERLSGARSQHQPGDAWLPLRVPSSQKHGGGFASAGTSLLERILRLLCVIVKAKVLTLALALALTQPSNQKWLL